MKKLLKLNSFWLRLIAIITMTIDHVGIILGYTHFYWMRIIGRIALPLFVFLTVQGALKTHNKRNYFLRIFVFLIGTSIVLIFLSFIPGLAKNIAYTSGNIFIDLLFTILCVWILESKNKKIKPLIILPVAYSIFSFIVIKLEGCACNGLYTWFPPAIRMQYGIYALMLAFGFYYSIKLAEKFYPTIDDDKSKQQFVSNLLSIGTIILVTCFMIIINYIFGAKYTTVINEIQTYAVFSGAFILFYNGARGYNAKWYRIFSYAYYPFHLAILGLICLF